MREDNSFYLLELHTHTYTLTCRHTSSECHQICSFISIQIQSHISHIVGLYICKLTLLFSLIYALKLSQQPHTASHLHSPLWLAAPFSRTVFGDWMGASTRRMSVCCHGDRSLKARVLCCLSTEERKCDLMPCPDSPTHLSGEMCSCVAIWLSASVWSDVMTAAIKLSRSTLLEMSHTVK